MAHVPCLGRLSGNVRSAVDLAAQECGSDYPWLYRGVRFMTQHTGPAVVAVWLASPELTARLLQIADSLECILALTKWRDALAALVVLHGLTATGQLLHLPNRKRRRGDLHGAGGQSKSRRLLPAKMH